MRIAVVALAIAAATLALLIVPLFNILIPYYSFMLQVCDLDLDIDFRIIEDSASLILPTIAAALCQLRSIFAFFLTCTHDQHIDSTFAEDRIFAQRIFYAEVNRYTPSAKTLPVLAQVADAAELAIATRDCVLLAEEESPATGNIQLLLDIGDASRAAGISVYRLLGYIKLGFSSELAIYRTYLAAMSQFGGTAEDFVDCSFVVNLSWTGTGRSTHHIRSELQRAMSSTSHLLALLHELSELSDEGALDAQCKEFPIVHPCSQLAQLATFILPIDRHLFAMAILRDVLDDGPGGYLAQTQGPDRPANQQVEGLLMFVEVKGYIELLEASLASVGTVRKAATRDVVEGAGIVY